MKDRPLIGTMIYVMKEPDAARILKEAGLDFFIIDNEHGMYSFESMERIIALANAVDIMPLVRVPMISREHIAKSLDCGARGLILPFIKSVSEVREALRLALYPPAGERGVALGRGNTAYKRPDSDAAYMKWANENILFLPQVETVEAVEAMDEIASLPGVSGLFFGPRDLSCSRGIKDMYDDPYMVESLRKMISVCRQRGLLATAHLGNREKAARWLEMGLNMLSYSGDASVMMDGYRSILTALRNDPGC